MKKIRSYQELLNAKRELPSEFAKYIEEEFQALYEYLSNGESVREFLLPSHQEVLILESKEEVETILGKTSDIEFIEEVKLQSEIILRIGIFQIEEVQLCYSMQHE